MKRLAALLILAAVLFTALVIVPQLFQAQRASQSVAASADSPVDASSLVGTWIPDGEASWEFACKLPQVAKKIAGSTPDKIERVKAFFLNAVATTTISMQ